MPFNIVAFKTGVLAADLFGDLPNTDWATTPADIAIIIPNAAANILDLVMGAASGNSAIGWSVLLEMAAYVFPFEGQTWAIYDTDHYACVLGVNNGYSLVSLGDDEEE